MYIYICINVTLNRLRSNAKLSLLFVVRCQMFPTVLLPLKLSIVSRIIGLYIYGRGGLSIRWKPLLRNVNQRNRNALVDSLTHACWPIVRSVRRLLVFVFRHCYNCVTINGRHYFVCRWTVFALSKAGFTFCSRRQTDRQAGRVLHAGNLPFDEVLNADIGRGTGNLTVIAIISEPLWRIRLTSMIIHRRRNRSTSV